MRLMQSKLMDRAVFMLTMIIVISMGMRNHGQGRDGAHGQKRRQDQCG